MPKLVGHFLDFGDRIKVARGMLLGGEQARGCWGRVNWIKKVCEGMVMEQK
jgi:hypothetical protein